MSNPKPTGFLRAIEAKTSTATPKPKDAYLRQHKVDGPTAILFARLRTMVPQETTFSDFLKATLESSLSPSDLKVLASIPEDKVGVAYDSLYRSAPFAKNQPDLAESLRTGAHDQSE